MQMANKLHWEVRDTYYFTCNRHSLFTGIWKIACSRKRCHVDIPKEIRIQTHGIRYKINVCRNTYYLIMCFIYHIPHSCCAIKFIHPEECTKNENASYVFIHQIKLTMVSRWELPPSFDSHASHVSPSRWRDYQDCLESQYFSRVLFSPWNSEVENMLALSASFGIEIMPCSVVNC